MKRAAFHPEAMDELVGAEAFYEGRVPGLGQRSAAEVERAIARICDHPRAGRQVARGLRRQVVSGFQYAVIYRWAESGVRIRGGAHQHRRPGYWLWRSREP